MVVLEIDLVQDYVVSTAHLVDSDAELLFLGFGTFEEDVLDLTRALLVFRWYFGFLNDDHRHQRVFPLLNLSFVVFVDICESSMQLKQSEEGSWRMLSDFDVDDAPVLLWL